MNSILFSCILLCAVLTQFTDGFSTGAPSLAIVCSTRRPQHYGAVFHSNSGGCSLTVQGLTNDHYRPGETYTVTISGCTLKGFLLQCFRGNSPTGRFSLPSGNTKAKTITCSSADDTATHQNSNQVSQVSVRWTPPSGDCTQIQCKATVVKSYSTIFPDISSRTFGCAPTPPPDPCATMFCEAFHRCVTIDGQGFCQDTCAPGRCGENEDCSLEEVECFTQPCFPTVKCTPRPTTPPPTTLPMCSVNQTLVGCGAVGCEGTCKTPSPQVCPEFCQLNACMCKNGFLRKSDGSCVHPNDCPGLCKENEQFNWCGTACEPTCDNPLPSICTDECINNVCQCKQGFVRSADNRCVPQAECPTTPPATTTVEVTTPLPTTPPSLASVTVQCPMNEEFLSCGSACEPTCKIPEPEFCTMQCIVNVCQCRTGFVRMPGENGQKGSCVLKTKCQVSTQPQPLPPSLQPSSECPAIYGCAKYGVAEDGRCCPPCIRNISACEGSDVDCVVDRCTRYRSKPKKGSCCPICLRRNSMQKDTPCSTVLCPRGRTCEEVNGKAVCRCKGNCRLNNSPVCGSDGKTYNSSCHLHLHVCHSCEAVELVSNRPCPVTNP